MMKRLYGFVLILFLLSGCGESSSSRKYAKIGTGSQVGVYYSAGLALAEKINEGSSYHGIDISVESTDGSVFNINSVLSGALDFGFAQADRQYQAVRGEGVWKGKPQETLRSICSLYPEAVTLIVTDSSGIQTLEDIKEKRISLGSTSSGTRGNAEEIFRYTRLVPDIDFEAEDLKASEAALFLQDGRIDGYFYTVGHPNGSVIEVTNGRRVVHFVPIQQMDSLLRDSPYYIRTKIPRTLYPQASNTEDVPTLAVLTTLVTSSAIDEEIVYHFTKTLFESLEEWKTKHPVLQGLNRSEMLQGSFAPLHPGAKKYLIEAGLL